MQYFVRLEGALQEPPHRQRVCTVQEFYQKEVIISDFFTGIM
jgi:hypothetical protein